MISNACAKRDFHSVYINEIMTNRRLLATLVRVSFDSKLNHFAKDQSRWISLLAFMHNCSDTSCVIFLNKAVLFKEKQQHFSPAVMLFLFSRSLNTSILSSNKCKGE